MTVSRRLGATHTGRRTVASYASRERAERAVNQLADRDFPVDRVTIVGRDVALVERVVGPTTYGSAALEGAVSGAVVGGVLGFLLGVLSIRDPIESGVVLTLYGLGLGAVLGAIVAALVYTARQRRFASEAALEAGRYELRIDAELADEAEAIVRQEPEAR